MATRAALVVGAFVLLSCIRVDCFSIGAISANDSTVPFTTTHDPGHQPHWQEWPWERIRWIVSLGLIVVLMPGVIAAGILLRKTNADARNDVENAAGSPAVNNNSDDARNDVENAAGSPAVNNNSDAISDQLLRQLSDQLGPKWEPLASYLHFSPAQIFKFKSDYRTATDDQIFAMLTAWREETSVSADMRDTLAQALMSCDRTDLAEFVRSARDDVENTAGSLAVKNNSDAITFDPFLRRLSKKLGVEWEQLASYLGFSPAQILKIKNDHQTTDNQIFAMLTAWREKTPVSADMRDTLAQALEMCDRTDLADLVKSSTGVSDVDLLKDVQQDITSFNKSTQTVMTAGFTQEANIMRHVRTFFKNSTGRAQALVARINACEALADIAWIPLFLVAVGLEWLGKHVPIKLTEFFGKMAKVLFPRRRGDEEF